MSPILLRAQNLGNPRSNDIRARWNILQFANIGRYVVQFGIEKDIADNKTLGMELGLCYFRTNSTVNYQRYDYKGYQGLVEYRNYFKGFHDSRVKPFLALGLFARKLEFDADVALAYNIKRVRDWESATHYEETSAHYNTFTLRGHCGMGFRMPISPAFYFETEAGPAFGMYTIKNDIQRSAPFVVDNFSNPLFLSSQPGTYGSPAFYGAISFGFVIWKEKPKP
ncbi:MAG: autotransporter outer membrane beta-barrel domain-containing protein [Bacteroidetes bacterium]|nr:autotransporter outer membrane beta-barrel domain-containing protein [Bacteroidota bacterium]